MKKAFRIILLFMSLTYLINFSIGAFAATDNAATSTNRTGLITYSDRKGTGDEVLLIRLGYEGDSDQFRQEMYRDATPNTLQNFKTIAAKGINALSVSANYFGVVVEPVAGQDFVIDLVGVKDPDQVRVDTGVAGSDLTVTVNGDRNKNLLISTVTDQRINTVRIGVPADAIQSLQLKDEKNSCILVNDLDIPIDATIGSGTARVQKEKLTAAVTMKCTNGDVIVKAKQVLGPTVLSASSGDAVLIADTVSGHAQLTASSGDVAVEVGTLHSAVLQATSGDVSATVTRIANNVKASVTSGDLEFHLAKHPANLRFVFDGKESTDDVTLPKGWTNGYKVGNGEPVLHLGVGSGELELTVG